MRICNKCFVNKDDSQFSFKNKKTQRLNGYCKSFHKEYAKQHYENNKEKYIKRTTRDRKKEKNKTKLLIEKLKPMCVVCGETWTGALDLHHIDPLVKESSIANISSRKKMIEESKKCIVLCATDHRKFHSSHFEVIEKVNAYVAQLAEAVVSKTT